jgi:hypothetical protein
VKGSITDLRGSAEGIDDSAACKLFAATTKRVTKGMPKQPQKLWAWLMDQDQKNPVGDPRRLHRLDRGHCREAPPWGE